MIHPRLIRSNSCQEHYPRIFISTKSVQHHHVLKIVHHAIQSIYPDCQYAILSHNIKHLKLSEPDLLVLASRKSSHRCPRSGLDASDRAQQRWPAAFATVSTPATENSIFGQPPSPQSRRRWPRSVAASLAAVSTPAAEIRRSGPPPSPRSRRRRPRSAAVARDGPASLAMVSTPAAEIRVRRGGPPPSPRSRRRRPRYAAVARRPCHGFDACDRDTPRWPASLAAVARCPSSLPI